MSPKYRRRGGYHRYKGGKRVNPYAAEQVRQYHDLKQRLGPIVEDVKEALFRLEHSKRVLLLTDYRRIYGNPAADYATRTFPYWESGRTKMGGSTATRMVNLVPKYLTQDQRYTIVQRLCDHHRKRIYRSIQIDPKRPSNAITAIQDALKDIAQRDGLSYLPPHVLETVTWLHDSDAVAARAVLAEFDRRTERTVAESIGRQWPYIESILRSKSIHTFSETFDFPTGELRIFTSRSSMCFVATAVYCDPNHKDVVILRTYRDRILMSARWGRSAMRCYYIIGPYLAAVLNRAPILRSIIKAPMRQLVRFINTRYVRHDARSR